MIEEQEASTETCKSVTLSRKSAGSRLTWVGLYHLVRAENRPLYPAHLGVLSGAETTNEDGESLALRQAENKHLGHRVHSTLALNVPSVKRNMHLKCPARWEVAVSVSACTILSSAVFSEAGSFLLRGGITGQHEAINNHLPCNVSKCKELTLVPSRVPAAAVL